MYFFLTRNGEESRIYLIECFEAYGERHMLHGFEAKHTDEDLVAVLRDVKSGRSKRCVQSPEVKRVSDIPLMGHNACVSMKRWLGLGLTKECYLCSLCSGLVSGVKRAAH